MNQKEEVEINNADFKMIDNLLAEVPHLLTSINDENFHDIIRQLVTYGKIISEYKNQVFSINSSDSENKKNLFERAKLIREMFDNMIQDRRIEMEAVSLEIQKISYVKKANRYRSIL